MAKQAPLKTQWQPTSDNTLAFPSLEESGAESDSNCVELVSEAEGLQTRERVRWETSRPAFASFRLWFTRSGA